MTRLEQLRAAIMQWQDSVLLDRFDSGAAHLLPERRSFGPRPERLETFRPLAPRPENDPEFDALAASVEQATRGAGSAHTAEWICHRVAVAP